MTVPIQTINLTKRYGQRRGIEDVNITVRPGEIFGFLGPNGAGKSTLLRTLTGLMRPTSGTCTIQGVDVHRDTVGAMRHVGNLPSTFVIDDRATGRQLLHFMAQLRGMSSLKEADALAERLTADLDQPFRHLSRGNRQKIGIIQALFHQPDVIILDEPTSGLDPLIQEQFLALLDEARAHGQTVLFSSHVLSEVERVADRVGMIREGRMIAIEQPQDLVSRAHRHVQVLFKEPPAAVLLEQLSAVNGVQQLIRTGERVSFAMTGEPNAVLALLSQQSLASLEIERPALEEIFLTYYGASGASLAGGEPIQA